MQVAGVAAWTHGIVHTHVVNYTSLGSFVAESSVAAKRVCKCQYACKLYGPKKEVSGMMDGFGLGCCVRVANGFASPSS